MLERRRPRGRARRVRLHRRPVGLRQVDAPERDRRLPARRPAAQVTVEGEPVRGPDRRRIFVFQDDGVFPWLTVEENVAFGLLRKSARGAPPHRRALRRAGRAGRLRARLPAPALGRHASAGRDRARARREPRHPLHGRAVRRARLPDPAEDARRPAPDLAARAQDGAVRDPRHRGGGAARRPGAGHDAAPRDRAPGRADRARAAARLRRGGLSRRSPRDLRRDWNLGDDGSGAAAARERARPRGAGPGRERDRRRRRTRRVDPGLLPGRHRNRSRRARPRRPPAPPRRRVARLLDHARVRRDRLPRHAGERRVREEARGGVHPGRRPPRARAAVPRDAGPGHRAGAHLSRGPQSVRRAPARARGRTRRAHRASERGRADRARRARRASGARRRSRGAAARADRRGRQRPSNPVGPSAPHAAQRPALGADRGARLVLGGRPRPRQRPRTGSTCTCSARRAPGPGRSRSAPT